MHNSTMGGMGGVRVGESVSGGGGAARRRPPAHNRHRAVPSALVMVCDVCVVVILLLLIGVACIWGNGGTAQHGHHHIIHGSVVHNDSAPETDATPRYDNALDGSAVATSMVHIHYVHIGTAVCIIGIIQHAAMIVRRHSTTIFLRAGIGAETTLHTLACNALSVLLCAEVSGLSNTSELALFLLLHGVAFALATAVLLHMHGAGGPMCNPLAVEGVSQWCGAHPGVQLELGVPPSAPVHPRKYGDDGGADRDTGATMGTGTPSTHGRDHAPGTPLRWFGVCPIRMQTAFPPADTVRLAKMGRAVAAFLLAIPWMWVSIYYIAGWTSAQRPDATIILLPPLLFFLNAAKISWIPGIAWTRSVDATLRTYSTESLFDTSIAVIIMVCALMDVVFPAPALVHVDGP